MASDPRRAGLLGVWTAWSGVGVSYPARMGREWRIRAVDPPGRARRQSPVRCVQRACERKEAGRMAQPLVAQLRFTRGQWQRALAGLSDEDARRRLGPVNCISWMVGHLAWQEQLYWLERAQGRRLVPGLDALVGTGKPASTPPLAEMQAAWARITAEADAYLDTLTSEALAGHLVVDGAPFAVNTGTLLYRMIYHYWFHTGEALAVRQQLGHTDLPEYVGDIQAQPPYQADSTA
jgi:uncharacterized damage-inducible protein DinB